MYKALSLKPLDVAVALRLAAVPGASYEALSHDLLSSASTVHGAVKRLEAARLLIPGTRRVNQLALREFLDHGVRYAFPAEPGGEVRGVPTAYSAEPLASQIASADPLVWPVAGGLVRGARIIPLLPRAAELPERCPQLYQALALVDALRVGRARERNLASLALVDLLRPGPVAA